jgi:hypothetical protein
MSESFFFPAGFFIGVIFSHSGIVGFSAGVVTGLYLAGKYFDTFSVNDLEAAIKRAKGIIKLLIH